MSKLITLLICCNLLSLNLGEYDPPKSVEYPFGDEIFNADISEERVQEEAKELNIEVVKDIAVFCPNKTEDDEEQRALDNIPFSENLCTKCDVRPAVDKRGVLLECFECIDATVMLVASSEETSSSHLLYLATYLEIANYSAPEPEE